MWYIIVDVFILIFEFVNTLRSQYSRNFKTEIFLTLFYNFNADGFKKFHKEAIYNVEILINHLRSVITSKSHPRAASAPVH